MKNNRLFGLLFLLAAFIPAWQLQGLAVFLIKDQAALQNTLCFTFAVPLLAVWILNGKRLDYEATGINWNLPKKNLGQLLGLTVGIPVITSLCSLVLYRVFSVYIPASGEIPLPSFRLPASILLCFMIACCEEAAWRGSLLPDTMRRFGKIRGLLYGGFIYGFWYWIILYFAGSFYGKSYPVFPYTGFVLFTIFAVSFNLVMHWLHEKAGSILAPCAAHTLLLIIQVFLMQNPQYPCGIFGPLLPGMFMTAVFAVFGIGILLMYIREGKPHA